MSWCRMEANASSSSHADFRATLVDWERHEDEDEEVMVHVARFHPWEPRDGTKEEIHNSVQSAGRPPTHLAHLCFGICTSWRRSEYCGKVTQSFYNFAVGVVAGNVRRSQSTKRRGLSRCFLRVGKRGALFVDAQLWFRLDLRSCSLYVPAASALCFQTHCIVWTCF